MAQRNAAATQCRLKLAADALDPIRDKVQLGRFGLEPPPFSILSNDTFPTKDELAAIAAWGELRDDCQKSLNATYRVSPLANAEQATFAQKYFNVLRSMSSQGNELIVALYHQKLTYGELAKKRYEVYLQGTDAVNQLQSAANQHDAQRFAAAEHQYNESLLAWSSYLQAINSRQPLTVIVR